MEFFSDDTDDTGDHVFHYPPPLTPPESLPFARIVEQPAKCGVRFRYECEGRISGAIPGENSTSLKPTFPAIKVFNFDGNCKVIVSCVTKNPPFRAHPHNLVGKKSCREGVCHQLFQSQDICQFNNLGILCAKRKDIRERLRVREGLGVDPFNMGFSHKNQAFKVIDLAVVRLCFQVYLETNDEFSIALEPLVSEPIFDKKAMSELSISKLSHYSASALGGQEIILLCDRVVKDDIQIRFYEEINDHVVWESFADFKSSDIHKHFAISFRSPRYSDPALIQTPRPVQVQLRRPSDGMASESLPFFLLPVHKRRPQERRVAPPLPLESNPLPPEGEKIDFFALDYYINSASDHVMEEPFAHWSESEVTSEMVNQSETELLDISERHANWSQSLRMI